MVSGKFFQDIQLEKDLQTVWKEPWQCSEAAASGCVGTAYSCPTDFRNTSEVCNFGLDCTPGPRDVASSIDGAGAYKAGQGKVLLRRLGLEFPGRPR